MTAAAWNGKIEVMQYLHKEGVDLHASDSSGRSPLTAAARGGRCGDIGAYLGLQLSWTTLINYSIGCPDSFRAFVN